jgi:hypothetical protein
VAPTGGTGTPLAPAVVPNRAPYVKAVWTSATLGKVVHLRFKIDDDHQVTRQVITVLAPSGRVRLQVKRPLGPTVPGRVYSVDWRVPSQLTGGLQMFCVRAFDAEGKQKQACAPLRLKS